MPKFDHDPWSLSVAAGWYSALAGVLATASLTTIVLLVSLRRDSESTGEQQARQAAVSLMAIGFVTNLVASFLFAVLAGDTEDLPRVRYAAMGATLPIAFGGLLLLAGVVWMCRLYQLDVAVMAWHLYRFVALLVAAFIGGTIADPLVREPNTLTAHEAYRWFIIVVAIAGGVLVTRPRCAKSMSVVAHRSFRQLWTALMALSVLWVLIIVNVSWTGPLGGDGVERTPVGYQLLIIGTQAVFAVGGALTIRRLTAALPSSAASQTH